MDNLEKSFKDALTGFDQVSPSKGLWGRISTSLFLKSTAFKAILWSLLALVIIVIPSIWIISKNYNKKNHSSRNKHSIVSILHKKTPKSTARISNKVQKENVNTLENTNKESAQIINEQKAIKQTKSISKTQKSTISEPVGIAKKIKNSSENTNQENKSSSVNKQKATEKQASAPKQVSSPRSQKTQNTSKKAAIISATNSPIIASAETSVSQKKQKETLNTHSEDQNSLQSTEKQNTNTKTEISNYSKNKELYLSSNSQTSINRIPLRSLERSYNPNDRAIANVSMRLPFNQQRLYYDQIEIFAGPNIAYSFIETDDVQYNEHINLRNGSEKPQLSYHLGVNYKTYYKKWFLSIGVNYHNYKDQATYSLPTLDIDSAISSYMVFHNTYKYITTGYIQNPNDTSSLIPILTLQVKQDTSLVNTVYYDTTEVVKDYTYSNTYSYIEVPIMFGRVFHHKHFVFDLAGGVSWGRLIKYESSIPNLENNKLINIHQTESIITKNSFNGIFSLGIGYQINEGSLLFARPEFRYNLNNLFESSYPINQKYLQIRLSLGMRFQL
jgi:hypothetical protein